jgi:hypothetical protein
MASLALGVYIDSILIRTLRIDIDSRLYIDIELISYQYGHIDNKSGTYALHAMSC